MVIELFKVKTGKLDELKQCMRVRKIFKSGKYDFVMICYDFMSLIKAKKLLETNAKIVPFSTVYLLHIKLENLSSDGKL